MSKIIYLDNAASSFPKPAEVIKETERCLRDYCVNVGRSAHQLGTIAAERIFKTREAVSELFNIKNPERIAFTLNTTMGLNMGLKGVLKRGDHLIISSMEHNSISRPAHSLMSEGVELSIAKADKNGEITFKNIKPLIRPNTKMVSLIHASNVTGQVNNISDIGRELKKYNIVFMVDAAQSAGIIPIDVRNAFIDILCFPGHKGLYGPSGTGGIYVSEKTSVSPIIQGGTGSMSESTQQPGIFPDILESGTPNVPGISALCEGVNFVINHQKEILEHETYISNILVENLSEIPGVKILGRNGNENTGIVGVNLLHRSPSEVAYLLDKDYNIAARAGFHCSPLSAKTLGLQKNGSLRFSVGFFNTLKDIDAASCAMKKILEQSN